MLPGKRIPTHPGEILSEVFLKPLAVTQVALAEHLHIPIQRVNELWTFGSKCNRLRYSHQGEATGAAWRGGGVDA